MNSTTHHTTRELDARSVDGLYVRLIWRPSDNTTTVTVADARTRELFAIPVDAQDAYDAFHHPFAYAPGVLDAHTAGGTPCHPS